MEAAVEILRKKGRAVAAKREDREASEGCVLAKNEGNFAAILALKCETDFVAKNAGFVELTTKLLDAAVANRIESIEALNALEIDGRTVADLVIEETGKTGEKCEIGPTSLLWLLLSLLTFTSVTNLPLSQVSTRRALTIRSAATSQCRSLQ